jgi:hypothetical protein
MGAVDADMVLVAKGGDREIATLCAIFCGLGLGELDRAARVAVLLAQFGGLAFFNRVLLRLRIALLGSRDDRRVDDLAAGGKPENLILCQGQLDHFPCRFRTFGRASLSGISPAWTCFISDVHAAIRALRVAGVSLAKRRLMRTRSKQPATKKIWLDTSLCGIPRAITKSNRSNFPRNRLKCHIFTSAPAGGWVPPSEESI